MNVYAEIAPNTLFINIPGTIPVLLPFAMPAANVKMPAPATLLTRLKIDDIIVEVDPSPPRYPNTSLLVLSFITLDLADVDILLGAFGRVLWPFECIAEAVVNRKAHISLFHLFSFIAFE